jgi:hypothetical protein
MRANLLALVFLTIFIICVSAVKTVSEKMDKSPAVSSWYTLTSDTVKILTEPSNDTTVIRITEAWKEWKTVQNHTFGKDRGNLPMIADLQSLHPYFRDKICQLIQNCRVRGIELAIVESYRTHAKQSEYYSMGKKYTRSAGGKSKHQYGLAVDLVPVSDSVALWDNVSLWRKVGYEGEKLGLRWGGRWRSPYDPAHFEWSGGLTTQQLSAGALPTIPAALAPHYPCLEDDVHELKKHWDVWEDIQLTQKRNGSRGQSMAASNTP